MLRRKAAMGFSLASVALLNACSSADRGSQATQISSPEHSLTYTLDRQQLGAMSVAVPNGWKVVHGAPPACGGVASTLYVWTTTSTSAIASRSGYPSPEETRGPSLNDSLEALRIHTPPGRLRCSVACSTRRQPRMSSRAGKRKPCSRSGAVLPAQCGGCSPQWCSLGASARNSSRRIFTICNAHATASQGEWSRDRVTP